MEDAIETLMAQGRESAVAQARFAVALMAKGDPARAAALAARALSLAPDDGEVACLAGEVMADGVPTWHFGIVRDAVRNAAYQAALARAVRPGMKVLEIGAGSGILSMMAARAGAREVIACEMNPKVAAAAQEIVARNGFADRVRIVAKNSTDLDPVVDLGGPADLLVSEIVDNALLGEGVLPAVEDAARRLLRPGAGVIPARGSLRVALAHYSKLQSRRMATIDGFDLSPFNRLASPRFALRRENEDLVLRSAPADLFAFDFSSGGPFPPADARVELVCDGSPVNGVAQWIRLAMDDTERYENDPTPGAQSCWAVLFHPFREERLPAKGERVAVRGRHHRVSYSLWTDR